MKREYTIDYKSFITIWRCKWIEVPKDVRKGKIWKPYDVTVPDPWSSDTEYCIRTAKYRFFLVVKEDDKQCRYLLNKELISLLESCTTDEANNKLLLEEIVLLKTELEKANSAIDVLKKELLKAQMELEMERRKKI